MRECRGAGAERRASEQGTRTIANAAFGKHADDAAVFQPFDRAPDRLAIGPIARGWKSIHRSQKMSEPWNREKFDHCHPIDLPPHHR